MTRRLTAEEAKLWRIATTNVQPLWARMEASRLRRQKPLTPAPKDPLLIHAAGIAPQSSPEQPAAPPVAEKNPVAGFERRQFPSGLDSRERKDLKKGKRPIDAVLDLHGFRAQEAHDRLVDFLMQAQLAGLRFVLVITGKGGSLINESFFSGESGVLRRQAPHWLSGARLRGIVGGFEQASPGHGGGGALYVRLRRRR